MKSNPLTLSDAEQAAIALAIEAIAGAIAEKVAAKIGAGRGPRLMSVKEAAAYLGRSPDAIRKLESLGELTSIRAGRRVQFDREDLDAWIKRNRVIS